jgi:cytochrome c556
MKGQGFVAILGAAMLASCSKPQPEPNHVQQLMAEVVQPQADIYWHSAGSVSDEEGVHDLTPTTDEGWQKAADAAVKIGEAGKLLMTDKYSSGRKEDWRRFSQGMVDIAEKARQAAADHDEDKVFEVGGTMYDVCSACHQAYPPPVPEDAGDNTDPNPGNG